MPLLTEARKLIDFDCYKQASPDGLSKNLASLRVLCAAALKNEFLLHRTPLFSLHFGETSCVRRFKFNA